MSIVIKQDTTSQTACLYEEEVESNSCQTNYANLQRKLQIISEPKGSRDGESTQEDKVSKEKNFDEEKNWVL